LVFQAHQALSVAKAQIAQSPKKIATADVRSLAAPIFATLALEVEVLEVEVAEAVEVAVNNFKFQK